MLKRSITVFAVAVFLSVLSTSAAVLAHEGREVGELEIVVGFLHEPAFEGQANGAFISIMKPGIDVETHGGLFSSGTVDPGGSFQFEFGHNLEDLSIQFHDHLTGNGGMVMVADDAEMSGTVMVQFDETGFSPSELHIQPDTTVMFMNAGSGVMTVLNGPHDTGDGHEHEPGDTAHAMTPILGAADTLQVEVIHDSSNARRTMALRSVFGSEGAYVADFVPTAPGAYTFRFFGEIDSEPFDQSFTSGQGTFDDIQTAKEVQFPVELREVREIQGAVDGIQTELAATGDTASDADSTASTALIIGIIGLIVGALGFSVGGYSLVVSRRKV